jgi:hypothetical protein
MGMDKYELKETLSRVNGLFVGQLDTVEMHLFEEACKLGVARESYDGAAGFLGLAKVVVL